MPLYKLSVLQPRNGARNVRLDFVVVSADSPDAAVRAVAINRARMHRRDHKIGQPEEVKPGEVVDAGSGTYVRSVEDDFAGRLVSDILCDIALDATLVED